MGKLALDLKIFPDKGISLNLYKRIIKRYDDISEFDKMQNFINALIEPYTDNLNLVSSEKGKIKELIFHYPKIKEVDDFDKMGVHHVVKQLYNLMPDYVHFIIITDDIDESKLSEVKSFFEEIPESRLNICRVVNIENEKYSPWASDPYKAVNNNGQIELIAPAGLIWRHYSDDGTILNYSSKFEKKCGDFKRKKLSFLKFDGGNILVGDDFILMGADILYENKKINIPEVVRVLFKNIANKDLSLESLYEKIIQINPDLNFDNRFGEIIKSLLDTILSQKLEDVIKSNKPDITLNGILEEIKIKKINIQDAIEKDLRTIIDSKENLEKIIVQTLDSTKKVYFLESKPPKDPAIGETEDCFQNTPAIVDIRGKHQAIYHLDLFITLAGYNEEKGQYQIIVGEPRTKLLTPELKESHSKLYDLISIQIDRMSDSINEIVTQLKGIMVDGNPKFDITRIPMPLTYHDGLDVNNEKLIRKWYWVSYNNCLVERTKDSKKIWYPSYLDKYSDRGLFFPEKETWKKVLGDTKDIDYGSWEDLKGFEDEVCEKLTKELDFNEAIPVKANFHWCAQDNGSLACLVNCVDRG